MKKNKILIIGSGAIGMAFSEAITESLKNDIGLEVIVKDDVDTDKVNLASETKFNLAEAFLPISEPIKPNKTKPIDAIIPKGKKNRWR